MFCNTNILTQLSQDTTAGLYCDNAVKFFQAKNANGYIKMEPIAHWLSVNNTQTEH